MCELRLGDAVFDVDPRENLQYAGLTNSALRAVPCRSPEGESRETVVCSDCWDVVQWDIDPHNGSLRQETWDNLFPYLPFMMLPMTPSVPGNVEVHAGVFPLEDA